MTVDSFSFGGDGNGNEDVVVVSRKSTRFSGPGPTTPTSAMFTVVDRDWDVYKKGDEDNEAWWERERKRKCLKMIKRRWRGVGVWSMRRGER